MKKEPFITKELAAKIDSQIPTPFHIYDEKGIRENLQKIKEAFAWNKVVNRKIGQKHICAVGIMH